jgi:DNA-binding MarR family transcriptional regulator
LEDKVNQPALKAFDDEGLEAASAAEANAKVILPFARHAGPNGLTGDKVRLVCDLRRKRGEIFPGKLLGDPTWDILLQLYATHLDGGRMSISRLTRCARVALTTVLRRLTALEEQGLVTRTDDPFDGRRVFVALSFAGAEAMHRCFAVSGDRVQFL